MASAAGVAGRAYRGHPCILGALSRTCWPAPLAGLCSSAARNSLVPTGTSGRHFASRPAALAAVRFYLRSSPSARAPRTVGKQLLQQCDAPRLDFVSVHRRRYGASWLAIVMAVAETTVPQQRSQFDERCGYCVGREMAEAEFLHAGRVHDPAFVIKSIQRGLGRGVLAGFERCRQSSDRAVASGNRVLISVDLPMPDWPISTLCWPSSHGQAAARRCPR